jgi:hypothetical protein
MFSSNASAVSDDANYIENVFSTWLYTGNGSTQTITNGVDLSGKGGLVWLKQRTAVSWTAWTKNFLCDTTRGAGKALFSDANSAEDNAGTTTLSSFTSTGFTLGDDSGGYGINKSTETYVGWTFREQRKFFDVVTWTGDGQTFRTVNHNLGAKPGFIICKCTSTTSDWSVLAKMSGGGDDDFIPLNLNSTAASRYGSGLTVAVSSTLFYTADLGFDGASNDQLRYNQNGETYVAYLFAHNAGGFGLSGTDNVVSCGSFGGTSGNQEVNLGWEPQWVMMKVASGTDTGSRGNNWIITDNMRGTASSRGASDGKALWANSAIEERTDQYINLTSTGFQWVNSSEAPTYIYIAIRRGPMKVPTTGTSVFKPQVITANGAINAGFPSDATLTAVETSSRPWPSRLSGGKPVFTNNTNAESGSSFYNYGFSQNSYDYTFGTGTESRATLYDFRRAPGFFDEVCYTGTGVARTVAHNLAAVPELMIMKSRSTTGNWPTYTAATGNTQLMLVNTTDAAFTNANYWNSTTPTSSVFTLGINSNVNGSGTTYVAYLFATCPGVSKVGSYTGTGTTLQINCGFTGGARFVMIKRTDDTGDWYVWDTARGIVSGNDPHLSLNTTAAEVTTDDTIDTDSTGFVVNQVSATNVNVSSATYIFLAIA